MGRGFFRFLDGAGAFAHPDEAGNGEYLPLVGDFMSFRWSIVLVPIRTRPNSGTLSSRQIAMSLTRAIRT